MFNLSGSEIVFLILIALVVLGPDKLPEAMRKAGKAYGDFKRMTSGFQSEMKSVLDEPMRELRETAELAKQSAMFDTKAVTKPQSGSMAPVDTAAVASGNMPVRTPAPNEPPAAAPIADTAPPAEQPAAADPGAAGTQPVAEPAVVAEPVVAAPVAAPSPVEQQRALDTQVDATSRRLARMQQMVSTTTVDPPAAATPTAADGATVE